MSETPHTSDETAEIPPAAATPAGPPLSQPGPPPAAPMPPGYVYPPQPAPQPYPFAPVAKEPWINPAKRTTVLVTAVVLAIVLLGGGFLVGAVSGHHRNHGGHHHGFYRPIQGGAIQGGAGPGGAGPGSGQLPVNRQRARPNPGTAPRVPTAPSPSASTPTS